VRLPLVAPATDGLAASNAGDSAMAEPVAGKARVLIVDDHHDVLTSLSRLLSICGYEVRAALSPTEALDVASEFRPQIAILDLGLPEMDGYTLAAELRSRLRESSPILIALSGYSQAEDKRRSDMSGFALHLVKPLDIDALAGTLEKLVLESR
jgi:CheY-like chemotaxis protein